MAKEQTKDEALKEIKATENPANVTTAAAEKANDGVADAKSGRTGILVVQTVLESGRRRAGMAFTTTPQEIDVSQLSEPQLEAIMTDPHLSVRPKMPDRASA